MPPPADLPEVAAAAWRLYIAEMASNRALRESDLIMLRTLCDAIYLEHQAMSVVYSKGLVVAGAFGPVTNPMIKVAKDATTTIRQITDVMGLNPMARIRGHLMEIAGASMVTDLREKLVGQLVKPGR